MKRLTILSICCLLIAGSVSSCKNCKKCHAEVGIGTMNINSPTQELCGDELKKAEQTAGMVCE